MVASGGVRDAVRRRFHTVVDAACLEEERARDWVIVRAMHDAYWTLDDVRSRGGSLDSVDRRWITTMVTVAKAIQG